MQCASVSSTGRHCRRKAAPDSDLCPYHQAWVLGPKAPDLWVQRVSREARRLVAEGRQTLGAPDPWAKRVSREARLLIAQGQETKSPPDPWAERVFREAQRVVAQAQEMQGLDAEIALLRLFIRDLAATDNVDAARRTIETLARVLTAQATRRHDPTKIPPELEKILIQLGEDDPGD